MSKQKDGGSAFPTMYPNLNSHTGGVIVQGGMTLRDYFAAKAMQSSFAGDGARMLAARDGRYDGTNWAEIVASNAYEMADAMLEERKK